MKHIAFMTIFLISLTTLLSADFTLDDLFTSGGTKQDKMTKTDSNRTNMHTLYCCL